jgi:hypothetical protein
MGETHTDSVFDKTALFGDQLTPQHSARNELLNVTQRRATVADLNMSKTSFGNQSRNSKCSATLDPLAKTSYTDLNTMLQFPANPAFFR